MVDGIVRWVLHSASPRSREGRWRWLVGNTHFLSKTMDKTVEPYSVTRCRAVVAPIRVGSCRAFGRVHAVWPPLRELTRIPSTRLLAAAQLKRQLRRNGSGGRDAGLGGPFANFQLPLHAISNSVIRPTHQVSEPFQTKIPLGAPPSPYLTFQEPY